MLTQLFPQHLLQSLLISGNLVVQAELALQILTMNGDVDRMLHSSHGDAPIMISAETYRNYNTILNAGQVSDSSIIPLKFTSVKSIVGCYRQATNINNFNTLSISSRRNPFASGGASAASVNVQMLCGNQYLPQIGMRTPAELYSEYSKSWHTLANVNSKTVICKSTYDQANEPGNPYWSTATNPFQNGNYICAFTTTTNLIQTFYPHGLSVGNAIVFTGTTSATNLTTNTMF